MAGWARLSETREGDVLVADSGFTCLGAGEHRVECDVTDGSLYVNCDEGHHGLIGQADDGENMVGLYRRGDRQDVE